MASTQELQRWVNIGGKVEVEGAQNKEKQADVAHIFVAPSGEKLGDWSDALKILQERENVKEEPKHEAADGKGANHKRGKENGEVVPARAAATKARKPRASSRKPAASKRTSRKKQESEEEEDIDLPETEDEGDDAVVVDDNSEDEQQQPLVIGNETITPAENPNRKGRRAAARAVTAYREAALGDIAEDYVEVKEVPCVESEAAALEETGGSASVKRRLVDFSLSDATGQPVPLERAVLMEEPVHVSGCIYPLEGSLAKDQGRRVMSAFGPVKEWKLVYGKGGVQVLLKTPAALYQCVRPVTSYRKVYAPLEEQAALAYQVYAALSPELDGEPTATFEEVLAKLTRAKVGKGYGGTRDALLLNAKFVLAQLPAMTAQQASAGSKSAVSYEDTPFGKALADEVAKGPYTTSLMAVGGGIRIQDAQDKAAAAAAAAAPKSALEEADEEMARRLQAKMNAKAYGTAGGRGAGRKQTGPAIIKISPEEIAADYPTPKPYEKEVDEADELLLFDEELIGCDPEYLPRRQLRDFAFYDADGFMSTLELVPMWTGADHDVEIYGSGMVTEDDGDWAAGGILTDGNAAAGDAGAGSSGAGGSGSSGGAAEGANQDGAGMRLYLSQIREWCVEFSCDMLFISIRTDVAWYRLIKPKAQYAPWFNTVLKSAQVAVRIINMIAEETRASKLSFNDIVRRLSDVPETAPTFISKKIDPVERFVVVHGQIILNQFKLYPNKAVQRAAFVGELKQRMEARKHLKLYMGKAKTSRGAAAAAAPKTRNANPMRNKAATGLKAKPMPATTTSLVRTAWQGYFKNHAPPDASDAEAAAAAATTIKEVEDDVNEEDGDEAEENALAEDAANNGASERGAARGARAVARGGAAAGAAGEAKARAKKPAARRPQLVGDSFKTDAFGRALYKEAKIGDQEVKLGDVVQLEGTVDDGEEETEGGAGGAERPLGLVLCLFEDADGEKMVQVRVLLRGIETVLRDASTDHELFVVETTEVRPLSDVCGSCTARRLVREWRHDKRMEYFREDEELRRRNDAHRAAGEPLEYVYRHLYCPEQGMYRIIPDALLDSQGEFVESPKEPIALALLPPPAESASATAAPGGFIKAGVEYRVGDFLYLHPQAFEAVGKGGADEDADSDAGDEDLELEDEEDEEGGNNRGRKRPRAKGAAAGGAKRAAKRANKSGGDAPSSVPAYAARAGGRHKGSNQGLKAFCIGQLLAVCGTSGKGASKVPTKLKVRRFFRPEDVSKEQAYAADWWEVYAAPAGSSVSVEVEDVVAQCSIVLKGTAGVKPGDLNELDTFLCAGTFDPSNPGAGVTVKPDTLDVTGKTAADKGKGKAMDLDNQQEEEEEPSAVAMASMDIFAGCGGLSEGMHQAGVAVSKWGVEYDRAAADAFALNNPDAKVFCNNCNVLLRAAMQKAGMLEDCNACDDCMEQAANLDPQQYADLPLPGEVEFMMGGPPCQGYSGMNRFNKGNWSMVQNSMVMSYLSYCDFYRPRYFLLENVRNFVAHNKSFNFRLTLRTLLDMGYQVRFGVLNAGNFGVPQSRKRTIIWAAAPNETLPNWPKPRHAFHSPQLTINLPGGTQYTAVPNQPGGGAPLRPVTVRDAICDLPPIHNGFSQDEQPYTQPAKSAFQRFIRGKSTVLRDHICKEMNELNLERCRCIPKNCPGADWRVLMEIVKNDPSREKFNGQPLVPWCLPNTMDRHNGWRGLFGRVDLNGHFPTATTDPQPMGKVGQVFHPEQDRIVSVRECARAQGFPDAFRFSGNVHNKHRQVGNAVPPPLAHALGSQLRKVLEDKRRADINAALMAQFGL